VVLLPSDVADPVGAWTMGYYSSMAENAPNNCVAMPELRGLSATWIIQYMDSINLVLVYSFLWDLPFQSRTSVLGVERRPWLYKGIHHKSVLERKDSTKLSSHIFPGRSYGMPNIIWSCDRIPTIKSCFILKLSALQWPSIFSKWTAIKFLIHHPQLLPSSLFPRWSVSVSTLMRETYKKFAT